MQSHITYVDSQSYPKNCTEYIQEHYSAQALQYWGKERYAQLFLDQVYLKYKGEEVKKEYERSAGPTRFPVVCPSVVDPQHVISAD